MSRATLPLTDVTLHSPGTRFRGVRAPGAEYRPWIAAFAECRALTWHQIAHAGLIEAVAPYEIVRRNQTSTYFLACYGGRGRVWIDGRWRVCGPGTACLLPAHVANAFHADRSQRWQFCYVCYVRSPGHRPISDIASPVLARFDPVPLQSAIEGLMHECAGDALPATLDQWVGLIQEYVRRFARPADQNERLVQLWGRVSRCLQDPWTLERLARESGYSKEHLRRLCHRDIGRSPVHHVMHLRMRRAAELLTATRDKIESIAQAVGYHSPFVFSNAFRKSVGWRPSEYRNHSRTPRTSEPGHPGTERARR
jgi:AraC-like DNA-binding protein